MEGNRFYENDRSIVPKMITALFKSFAQLNDPPIRVVLVKTFLWSLLLFAAIFAVFSFVLTETSFFASGWLEDVVDWLGGAAVVIISLLMFPSIAVLILGFYLEAVAGAVEARHYPDLEPAREQGVSEAIVIAVKFALAVAIFNIPVLFFLLIPPLFPFVFYGVNGYLLGREYFELVALRRLTPENARTLRKAYTGRLILCGAAISFLASLPVVNLVVPIVATILMVHVVTGLRADFERRTAPASGD